MMINLVTFASCGGIVDIQSADLNVLVVWEEISSTFKSERPLLFSSFIIFLINESRHWKAVKEWMNSTSPKTPTPQSKKNRWKEEKGKTVKLSSVDTSLKTLQSYFKKPTPLPMNDQSTTCNCTGTNVTGSAPQSLCIWLSLILYSIQNTLTDRRCMGKITFKHNISQETGSTGYTVQQPKVCIGRRVRHRRTVLENGKDKTVKASHQERLITKYASLLPHDAEPLGSCSGNRMRMLLKDHLSSK